jgi:hypothetical protein
MDGDIWAMANIELIAETLLMGLDENQAPRQIGKRAVVAELVDAPDLKSGIFTGVGVRNPPAAPSPDASKEK